jgi:hypothetical protein
MKKNKNIAIIKIYGLHIKSLVSIMALFQSSIATHMAVEFTVNLAKMIPNIS